MNGAGKSTLLYLMSSLLLPSGGVIEVNGEDVSKRTAEVLSEIIHLEQILGDYQRYGHEMAN